MTGSEHIGASAVYDQTDGEAREMFKGRGTHPSSELRPSTNMDRINADNLNERTGDGGSSIK